MNSLVKFLANLIGMTGMLDELLYRITPEGNQRISLVEIFEENINEMRRVIFGRIFGFAHEETYK